MTENGYKRNWSGQGLEKTLPRVNKILIDSSKRHVWKLFDSYFEKDFLGFRERLSYIAQKGFSDLKPKESICIYDGLQYIISDIDNICLYDGSTFPDFPLNLGVRNYLSSVLNENMLEKMARIPHNGTFRNYAGIVELLREE